MATHQECAKIIDNVKLLRTLIRQQTKKNNSLSCFFQSNMKKSELQQIKHDILELNHQICLLTKEVKKFLSEQSQVVTG